MGWAFQKDSDLADMFNYHLLKMQEVATLDRLRQEIEHKHKSNSDASQIHSAAGLGFENVAFPFMALMMGFLMASVQFGIELVLFYKNRCMDGVNQTNEDDSKSKEAKGIIEDIYDLLLEKHSKPQDIWFLSKIKTLALSD